MPSADNKKRHLALDSIATPSGEGAYLTVADFAQLAGITERMARKALARASDGYPWRGARLSARERRGAGGAAGVSYEVSLSSLPAELQAQWMRDHRPTDVEASLVERAAFIEEERMSGERRNRERFVNVPWDQVEREMHWAAFDARPQSVKDEARRRLDAVRFFHSFDGSDVPVMERYRFAARQAGTSEAALRRWVGQCRNRDRGDWIVALAPRAGGARTASDLSEEAFEYIKAEFFQLTKPSLKPIYRRAKRLAKQHGWTLPSYDVVKRRLREVPHDIWVKMREGEEAFELLFPTQERSYADLPIHRIWCADGRRADVFVRWPDGEVSRPIVLGWIEVRTRVVLGYAIGKVESTDIALRAFKRAAERARALPDKAQMDNGRAFASKELTGGAPTRFRFKVRDDELRGVLPMLGVEPLWATPYRGRSKPIESFWRVLAEADKRFPGAYTGNSPGNRPEDCDPAKAVPLERFQAVIEETLADYHANPHRGDSMDGRTPVAVYEELIASAQHVRQPTAEQLRLCMLKAEQAKIDRKSGAVRVMDNRYWSEKLASLPRDVTYTVRYNPEDATEAVSVYDGGKFLCSAPLIERTGFENQEAAKAHVRAHRRFLKSLDEREQAIKQKQRARLWGDAGDIPEDVAAAARELVLPTSKVVRPLRPTVEYEAPPDEQETIPQEEVWRILNEALNKRAGGKPA